MCFDQIQLLFLCSNPSFQDPVVLHQMCSGVDWAVVYEKLSVHAHLAIVFPQELMQMILSHEEEEGYIEIRKWQTYQKKKRPGSRPWGLYARSVLKVAKLQIEKGASET